MGKVSAFFDRLSISKKLAFWYGLSLFVMLSLFGYFLYESFHNSIHHNYDRHLRFEAEQLLPHIHTDDSLSINLKGYSRNAALESGVEYGTYVRLYNQRDSLIYKSPNFSDANQPLDIEIPDQPEEYSFSSQWQDLPARTLFYPINNGDGEFCGWLEVTVPMDSASVEARIRQKVSFVPDCYKCGILYPWWILAFQKST